MRNAGPSTDGWSRRELLQRGAFLTAAAYAISLAPGSRAVALLAEAAPEVKPLVRDTLLGLAAYVYPGDDAYSKHQGESAAGPGGPDSRALPVFAEALNKYLPAGALSNTTLPLADAAAAVLNGFAMQVNPASSAGPFPSPFANLTFAEKNEVFRQVETEAAVSGAVPEVDFVAGVLITFAALIFYSDAGHYDWRTKTFDGVPLSWELTGFGGPADGHPELRGYYRGIRAFRRESDVAKYFPNGACCLKKPRKGVHGRPRGRCKKPAKGGR